MRSLLVLLAALTSCVTPPGGPPAESVSDAPYVLVLGTAQDGGLPQIGCQGPHCRRARRSEAFARRVTSLLLCDPTTGERWLFDASPDLPRQVEAMHGHPSTRALAGPRPPLVDGVFLTHAHMGHYLGLAHFGPEAYGARDLPVWGTPRMQAYLRGNGPWSLLVEAGTIVLRGLAPGERVVLNERLAVRALAVPHREEFTDTVAFVLEGPRRSLLYLPDIDKWERWDVPIEEVLADVDVALLDASFFDAGEIPGRDLADIPHPFVVESLARFAPLPASERAKVRFTHLNHSNPVCDPDSEEAARVRDAGMFVASDGERHAL